MKYKTLGNTGLFVSEICLRSNCQKYSGSF
ncbi:hypothetical protein HDIA_1702 [Hartmannibacter diazotrophicus]|uniref:Uncharacterized protein n=1 Tax=Hartmannibacter diazotrophicus TaxID=1482074 RepID=A0A2C9D4U2_9HYPH|nr:hypothetical protein HDIA_1702 [Hartmannibacter diazotrophicus]